MYNIVIGRIVCDIEMDRKVFVIDIDGNEIDIDRNVYGIEIDRMCVI